MENNISIQKQPLSQIMNIQLDDRQNWTSHLAQNGFTYYFNKKTNLSQWEKPQCLMTMEEQLNQNEWQEYVTSEGKIFYYNKKLNQSQWKIPIDLQKNIEGKTQQSLVTEDNDITQENFDIQNERIYMEQQREVDIQQFRHMLKEKKVTALSKWDHIQKICGQDERFMNVKQIKEKKKLFFDYIQELKKKERDVQKKQSDNDKVDFFKMLEESKLNSDIKYYKSWPQFSKDQRFRAVEEKLRESYFQDYMDEIFEKERNEDKRKKYENQEFLKQKILALPNFSQLYLYDELCRQFENDRIFKRMYDIDKIIVFSELIRDIEGQFIQSIYYSSEIEQKNNVKKMQERNNREDFRDLLIERIYQNQLNNKTKYRNFVNQIKDDSRFLNLLNQPGSTPFELFQDQVELLKEYHSDLKGELKKYAKEIEFKMTKETGFEFFCNLFQNFQLFNSLEELLKRFFYNKFLNKSIKQEKEQTKKAKKIQKKYFKFLKKITQDVKIMQLQSKEEVFLCLNSEIETNPQLEKLKNVNFQLREEYYNQYLQLKIQEEQKQLTSDDDQRQKGKKQKKNKQKRKFSELAQSQQDFSQLNNNSTKDVKVLNNINQISQQNGNLDKIHENKQYLFENQDEREDGEIKEQSQNDNSISHEKKKKKKDKKKMSRKNQIQNESSDTN